VQPVLRCSRESPARRVRDAHPRLPDASHAIVATGTPMDASHDCGS
jgi:hypothetical protein